MMETKTIALFGSLIIILLLLIFNLIRQNRLRISYSWLWMVSGFTLFFLIFCPHLLEFLTHFTGIRLKLNVIYLASLVLLAVINLHFSIMISIHTERIKELAQRVALLTHKIRENEVKAKNIIMKNPDFAMLPDTVFADKQPTTDLVEYLEYEPTGEVEYPK